MPNFNNVRVGDILKRVHEGITWNTEVIGVDDAVITCAVMVGDLRSMKFDRQTGVNVDGKELGYIELP